jgi:hypothetical protein
MHVLTHGSQRSHLKSLSAIPRIFIVFFCSMWNALLELCLFLTSHGHTCMHFLGSSHIVLLSLVLIVKCSSNVDNITGFSQKPAQIRWRKRCGLVKHIYNWLRRKVN